MRSRLALTLALLGLLVAPSATAAEYTLYCNYYTDSGKPFVDLEMTMYTWGKFGKRAKVTYVGVEGGRSHEEELTIEKPQPPHQLFVFSLSKTQPDRAMAIIVLNDVADPNEEVERWPSVAYKLNDRTRSLGGVCYLD